MAQIDKFIDAMHKYGADHIVVVHHGHRDGGDAGNFRKCVERQTAAGGGNGYGRIFKTRMQALQ